MRVWMVALLLAAVVVGEALAQWPPVTAPAQPATLPPLPEKPTTPDLHLTALGFGAKFRNRAWAPLRCRIENPAGERTGLAVAEAKEEFSGQVTVYARPLRLPARGTRLFEFPAFCDLPANWDPKAGLARTALKVKITDGGLRVWDEGTAVGAYVPEESLFVLCADTRWPSYKFLDELLVGPGKRPVGRAVIGPADLPRRPINYRGVDVVILGALEKVALSPLQVAALRSWVAGGGLLFLVPGADGQLTDFDPLGDLVPVQYVSASAVSSLPALERWRLDRARGGSLDSARGRPSPPEFPEGLRFTRMIVCPPSTALGAGGGVLLGDRESPVVVAQDYGLGRVVALAFDAGDMAAQRWAGAAAMWTEWLGWRPQFFQDAERVVERAEQTDTILSNLAGIKVVTRATMKWYLAALVGGLAAVLLLFRLTRRPEWGWVVIAVLAVAGGVGAALAAQRWKAQPQACLNEVYAAVTTSGSEWLNVYAVFGLFSPREATYRLEVTDEAVAVQPGRTATVLPQTFAMAYEERLTVEAVPVAESGMRPLSGRATLTGVAAPVVRAQLGGDGVDVEVANPGGVPLTDCFFKFNRLVVPLGDVPAGGTWQARGLTGSAPGAETQFSSRVVQGAEDAVHQLFRSIFYPDPTYSAARKFSPDMLVTRRFRTQPVEPALFGWTDRPVFPVDAVAPPVVRRGVGLWAARTTARYAAGRLWLPKGVLPLVHRNKGALMTEQAEGRFGGNYGQQVLVEFQLPPGCPALTVDEATLFVAFRATAFEARASVAPRELVTETEPNPAQFARLPGAGPRFALPQPGRFYNPDTRSFLVAVEIEPLRRPTAGGEAWQTSVNYWQIRDLDLEVKGVTQ